MKAWWQQREPRERLILGGGGALALVVLGWLLVWAPLTDRAVALRQGLEEQEKTLAWMRDAAGEVLALRGQGARPTAGLNGRSLLSVVDQSARQAGLGGQLKRVDPDGADRVRVRFEGVTFDGLVTWLDGLGRQFGVSATQVSVDPVEKSPGRVDARLTLIAAAP